MKIQCSVVVMLAASCVLAAESFLPMYQQKLSITFPTEADAQKAAVSIETMPFCKTLAFSTRWDDSNPEHSKMIKVLDEQGYKGSFYINNPDKVKDVLPLIVKSGGTVGAHTMTHPHLPQIPEPSIFGQIIGNRVQLECAAGVPVVAFTLPFCDYFSKTDPKMPEKIGRALSEAGLLGSPEFWPSVSVRYGLGPKKWVGSLTFEINDRDPQLDKFNDGLSKYKEAYEKKPLDCGPHLTLGIHTWQKTAENFKRFGEIIATHGKRPEVWYCNENDYIAFRLQALNALITKGAVKGKTAEFMIERPEAFALGAEQPLCITLSTPAVQAQVDGEQVDFAVVGYAGAALVSNAALAVPAAKGHGVPTAFDAVYNKEHVPAAEVKVSGDYVCGIQADVKTGKVNFVLRNCGAEALSQVIITPRFSPTLEIDAPRFGVDALKAGESLTREWSFKTKAVGTNAFWFVAQCDWLKSGKRERLYAVEITDAVPVP